MSQQEKTRRLLRRKRFRELFGYFSKLVRQEGFWAAFRRTMSYLHRRFLKRAGRLLPTAAVLQKQREMDTAGWPVISILLPAYDPNPAMFSQLIQSIVSQTYPRWQLCVANAGTDKKAVEAVLAKYQDDARIVCLPLENEGISANTNRAASLATGDYITLVDHDDVLAPHALYEMAKAAHTTNSSFIYSDEALFTADIRKPSVAHFKPDYSLEYLLCCNYIAHLALISRDIFSRVGGLRAAYDGSQDHDLFLRVLEITGSAFHVPKVLYYWRQHAASTSTGVEAKPYVENAAQRAVEGYLARKGIAAGVERGLFPSTCRVVYAIEGTPLVSVIIPSSDHAADLQLCVESLVQSTDWPRYEIIIVENGSKETETFVLYEKLKANYQAVRIENCPQPEGFNFSSLCNFGRSIAKGEVLLFLNNDTETIHPSWMREMLSLCLRPGIGAVGALLYYPDDTVQHAGIILGLGGYAGHSHKYARRGASGYMFRLGCVQEVSAVTGAALMTGAVCFDRVGGFDEAFAVAYNDVDYCLRLGSMGYAVLFTPHAQLYHHESKSRGSDEKGTAARRAEKERALLSKRYGNTLLQDPYYNPNLTKDREDFSESDILPPA